MLGTKLVIVVLDNRGYGCINRLQQAVRRRARSTIFSTIACRVAPARRASTSPRTRLAGRARREREDDRRARGGARRAPARPTARTSSASTPIPRARPSEAAGGGRSRCRKCRSAREVRRARDALRDTTRKQQKTMTNAFERQDRHQPDFVEQRRPAVARRRDAARDGAHRRQGDRLPGLRARQQVSARVRGAARGACARTASSSCPAGTPGRLARRSVEDEIAAVARISKLLADNGAKVMVYGEVADSIQGAPQPLCKRPRFFTTAQWEAYAERVTALRAAHAVARRARSPTIITWARTSRRRPTSIELMARDRRRGRPAVRHRPHDLRRRRCRRRCSRKHVKRVCHVHCKDVRPDVISAWRATATGAFSSR